LRARAVDLRTPISERIELFFALGRLHDQAGDYDAAFNHFSGGNSLLRELLSRRNRGFDRRRLRSDVDSIIASFPSAGFPALGETGNFSEQPVFVVGMPRSGSSLFEQVAATHPEIFGAGGHKGIGAVAGRLGWAPSPAWTEQAITAAANGYLSGLPNTDAKRIIDKMPDNIFQLGLIAFMFPNARVVFCERDPRDPAISCFFQRFSEPYGFETDQEDIAYRIRELERLKNHWTLALPLRCLNFSYEKLLQTLNSNRGD